MVSIVLPVFNGEKYLRESIESVLEQTYENWELIIVDDCSSDGTYGIAKAFAEKDARIKLIKNVENMRLPASINIGFEHARGAYYTWTSDDNLYLPVAIEEMLRVLEKDFSIPMVVAKMKIIDNTGAETGETEKYKSEFMYYDNCVGACFMYRSQVADVIGGYDSSLFLAEDYDYWLRILDEYGLIYPIDKVLYKYRIHSNSLTSKRFREIRECVNRIRLKHIDMIFEQYKNNTEWLCRVYWDFKRYGGLNDALAERFFERVPILAKERNYDEQRAIVVYGAGDYGNKAFECYGQKIKYYVDKDERKVGSKKNGIVILPIDRIGQMEEYQIMIAVSDEKIPKIIDELMSYGVDNYVIFQNTIREMDK